MTQLVRRAFAIAFCAVTIATGSACRQTEPASVQELYTTRMLGLSYLRRNQLAEAEAEFRKLTTLAPDDAEGYADLGLTFALPITYLRPHHAAVLYPQYGRLHVVRECIAFD